MPTYNFRNIDNEEIIEVKLKNSEISKFQEENPNYKKIIMSAPKLVTGHTTARQLAGTEWNDKLKEIKKNAGKGSTINT